MQRKLRGEKLKGEGRAVLQQWDQFLFHNGLLYRRFKKENGNSHLQLVIPISKQEGVLSEVHAGSVGEVAVFLKSNILHITSYLVSNVIYPCITVTYC